ncbi:hypothetical protein [Cryptobacterium curtum]|mgnify:CR=1 FL=1|nr:hypothetical protein [Cryptobacterium curtum]
MADTQDDTERSWIDEAFDDRRPPTRRMAGSSKAAIGCGCFLAILLMVIIGVLGLMGALSLSKTV